MGRTRTSGISLEADGTRSVDKVWRGERIRARLGHVTQEEAERWLAAEIASRGAARDLRGSSRALFADGAARYLIEAQRKKSAEVIAWHIKMLLPYIGRLPLDQIHDGTLEDFVADRLAGHLQAEALNPQRKPRPVSATTVNRTLEVVRTILNRAARAWRDKAGMPLLQLAPPLITMLEENPRMPYPLSWTEQDSLMAELPAHLVNPVLLALNTGLRDENVVGLRWGWEQRVREIGRSVFVVPPEHYKTGVPHVVILNDVAWSVVEQQRGKDAAWVFPYTIMRGGRPITDRLDTINNTGFQGARARAGLPQVRVHDLRHTFASRLRLAGVEAEDRNALMGHGGASMPEHYASADLGRLVELANHASDRQGTRTILKVVAQAAVIRERQQQTPKLRVVNG